MLLLEVAGQFHGRFYVALLAGLVATRQQDDQFPVADGVVNAVAGSNVDLEFGHAIGQVAVLPGIAICRGVQIYLRFLAITSLNSAATKNPLSCVPAAHIETVNSEILSGTCISLMKSPY